MSAHAGARLDRAPRSRVAAAVVTCWRCRRPGARSAPSYWAERIGITLLEAQAAERPHRLAGAG